MDLDAQLALQLYERMVTVRRLEEAIGDHHKQGRIKGPVHRCDGQEAVGIGVTAALRSDDVITSTHRGHAHYLGKGADLTRVVCEITGRASGYGRGRAGHMLIGAAEAGVLGGNGIVAGGMPIAAGMAYAFQVRGEDRIAASFLGDGAVSAAPFGETLNLAAIWTLPVLFICEHNSYALTVHSSEHLSVDDVTQRAAGYGIPGEIVDGNDLTAVYESACRAVDHIRSGGGPFFLEAKTYRLEAFSTSDVGGYRDPEEEAEGRSRDPIPRMRSALVEHWRIDEGDLAAAEQRAAVAVEQAFASALESPLPGAEALDSAMYGGGG